MRIIQIIPQNVLGGAERYGFTLSAALARRGHEVLLLANRDNGPLFEREMPPGMQARALDRASRLDPRILSFLIGSARRFRPHVIHAHNFEANTWARVLGHLFPKVTIISHLHSGRMVTPQSLHRTWIDRFLFRRADHVFTLTEAQRQVLTDRLGVRPDRLQILPNGIDMALYPPSSRDERDPKGVVCVASLTEVKNHADLLNAWVEIVCDHADARLTLIGDGPLRRSLEMQARRDGIDGTISFAGVQSDIRPYLRRAGIFVLYSHQEAMPLALLEAMAAGLACVASRVGGIPVLLQDGEAGVLVPPRRPAELAAAIKALLADPAGQRKLGSLAREKVERDFALERQIDQIESVYREAVRRRVGPAGVEGEKDAP